MEKPDQKDPFDGEYVGNIFGWRISIIGAIVILLFGGLALYRHITMDIPFGFEDPDQEPMEVVEDSLKEESLDSETISN